MSYEALARLSSTCAASSCFCNGSMTSLMPISLNSASAILVALSLTFMAFPPLPVDDQGVVLRRFIAERALAEDLPCPCRVHPDARQFSRVLPRSGEVVVRHLEQVVGAPRGEA